MIEGKKVLGLIPARGGSKGVPGKNIKLLHGKPLIAWTIESAKGSALLDTIVCSTEDKEIGDVCRQWNCKVLDRPQELALDTTPGIAPVLHAMEVLQEFDWVVLLQPTSPFRTPADIDACLKVAQETGCALGITESPKSPWWMYTTSADGKLSPVLPQSFNRRQDIPVAYAINGAVYAASRQWLNQHRSFLSSDTLGYQMPQERAIDIDTEFDFWLAEQIARKLSGQ